MGWLGVGYNFVIHQDGTVHRGRPETAIGSHTKGHNSNSIGICLAGNYTSKVPPKAQFDAAVLLLKDLRAKYSKTMPIKRHKDFNATACPGDMFPFTELVNAVNEVDKPKQTIRTLSQGVKGEDVKNMQGNLIELGYDLGSYGADGSFGGDTKKAVLAFQKDNALEQDARVGPATRAKLAELSKLPVMVVATNSSPLRLRSVPVYGGIVAVMPKGARVRILKEESGWCKVIYGRLRGWCSKSYLK